MVLLFGMNQAWHARQAQVKVRLSDRIVLRPFAAKRLSLLLGYVIKDYGKRSGVVAVGVRWPQDATVQ